MKFATFFAGTGVGALLFAISLRVLHALGVMFGGLCYSLR